MLKGFCLLITGMFLALLGAADIHADTTYVIKKGDNPSRLAKKFKVSAEKIISANGLEADNLKPGTRITIPSKKKAPSSRHKSAKVQDKKLKKGRDVRSVGDSAKAVTHREDASVHVVKKGDSLLSISKKYSVPAAEIKEMNSLRTKRLKVGQRLIVRRASSGNYTVKKGDTLWNIAKRFDLDPDELRDMNKLETDSLTAGQKILVAAEAPEKEKAEGKEPKTYEAILSQAHLEKEIEKISGSDEIGELGMRDRLSLFAKKLLNIPYRFGGNTLFGIDCSAYVKRVYGLIGVDLPRSAREQFHEGTPVEGEQLTIGDLVFFKTYASFPSHVGIYLGNNLFIHASSRSKKVTIDSLDTPYYLKRFIGAKRLLDIKEAKEDPEKQG